MYMHNSFYNFKLLTFIILTFDIYLCRALRTEEQYLLIVKWAPCLNSSIIIVIIRFYNAERYNNN